MAAITAAESASWPHPMFRTTRTRGRSRSSRYRRCGLLTIRILTPKGRTRWNVSGSACSTDGLFRSKVTGTVFKCSTQTKSTLLRYRQDTSSLRAVCWSPPKRKTNSPQSSPTRLPMWKAATVTVYGEMPNARRRARNGAGVILGGLTGVAPGSVITDVVSVMTSTAAQLFIAGHGRDREREADLFSSLYLNNSDIADAALVSTFRKLQFAHDASDPFGDGGGGLFASHPYIAERLARASTTVAQPFSSDEVFHGISEDGARVATLRFDVQRLFENQLDVRRHAIDYSGTP